MASAKESTKRVQLDPKEKAIFWKIIKDSQGGKVWKYKLVGFLSNTLYLQFYKVLTQGTTTNQQKHEYYS